MIDPADTLCPFVALTPKRRPIESRPLLLEPPCFFVAIVRFIIMKDDDDHDDHPSDDDEEAVVVDGTENGSLRVRNRSDILYLYGT